MCQKLQLGFRHRWSLFFVARHAMCQLPSPGGMRKPTATGGPLSRWARSSGSGCAAVRQIVFLGEMR